MAYSVVEREAMAILEGFHRFSDLLRTSRALVHTDQKALLVHIWTQLFQSKKWQVDSLGLGTFGIQLRTKLSERLSDALSVLASLQPSCKTLHETLARPGVTGMYEYIQRHKVPFTTRQKLSQVIKCLKPDDFKPNNFRPSDDLL